MIKWFKQLLHIVKHFDDIVDSMEELSRDQQRVEHHVNNIEHHVNDAVQTIKDRTTIHADIAASRRHQSQIIMIGNYRNRDYIQTFEVHPDDFSGMLRQCIEMQKYARMGKIDAPIGMKEIINTESEKYWGEL